MNRKIIHIPLESTAEKLIDKLGKVSQAHKEDRITIKQCDEVLDLIKLRQLELKSRLEQLDEKRNPKRNNPILSWYIFATEKWLDLDEVEIDIRAEIETMKYLLHQVETSSPFFKFTSKEKGVQEKFINEVKRNMIDLQVFLYQMGSPTNGNGLN